ncbi:acetylxylan esterase [Neurospora crassa OR74A]|uniref:Acetylxylan esterase n=2 Tax=Neurospora crassa TaxID=5141 RepID=Q1K583_NEUCR|nr:acetylxylan esterase [Neurospora crassa OR74A]EAA27421.1 acetylxylan esterase [Neurospora crassa OR74A]CAD70564.1 hypothetical protein [Neurospora crassa]|eukprot:XP_956657.1 acetylxylan esterase [Neurospora crassa OR74A]
MWPSPKAAYLLLLARSALVGASPVELEERQSCPSIHVFGARETTVSPGFGTAGVVVNLILQAYPGATSEAIVYPACGGQSSCGGVQYGDSARQGTNAVATAVNSLNARCPDTQIVLVGYSQGGQIMDNAVCGGPDSGAGITTSTPGINASALNQVKAVIMMGNPRYRAGLSYNVGTCTAYGFDPRPAGYTCASASKLQNYCDSPDPYCCTGNDANTHQGYGSKYGQQALAFVKSKLSSGGGGGGGSTPTTPSNPSTPTNPSTGNCAAKWGQCGGQGWTGATCCQSGSTCQAANQWYSQCI